MLTTWLIRFLIGFGATLVLGGSVSLAAAPYIGPRLFDNIWKLEPLTYVGYVLLSMGLGVASTTLLIQFLFIRRSRIQQRIEVSNALDRSIHDLKRPVEEILRTAQSVERYMDGLSHEDLRRQTNDLIRETERQTSSFGLMIENARTLVGMKSEELKSERIAVDIAEIIQIVCARYVRQAQNSGIEICFSQSDSDQLGMVYSDSHAISQIVTNLVDNAVRYASSRIELQLIRSDEEIFWIKVWETAREFP